MITDDVIDVITASFDFSISTLFNPKKRVYVLYLLSSFALAFYVYRKSKSNYSFLKYIFNRKIWASTSAYIDYFFFFFNSIIKLVFIGPYLILGLYISFYVSDYMTMYLGVFSPSLSAGHTIILYTIALTLFQDFFSYLVHLAFHKNRFLWEFHKIHHSAKVLNPITQYRIHPGELLINNTKGILVFGVITGLFDYLSNFQVHTFDFIGVNILSFVFLFWGSNLRHSHVKLSYFSPIENIFISPSQHQIHHSTNPIHYNKNMGAKLALWDFIFGTLVHSKKTHKITFGLGKEEDQNYNSFLKNLYRPFVAYFQMFRKK
jgi:sterol desaturase/sphingolipid hydroxylase (fatty acid hydroxylase superfamily)